MNAQEALAQTMLEATESRPTTASPCTLIDRWRRAAPASVRKLLPKTGALLCFALLEHRRYLRQRGLRWRYCSNGRDLLLSVWTHEQTAPELSRIEYLVWDEEVMKQLSRHPFGKRTRATARKWLKRLERRAATS